MITQREREQIDRLLRSAQDGISFGAQFVKLIVKLRMASENNEGVTLNADEVKTLMQSFRLLKDHNRAKR